MFKKVFFIFISLFIIVNSCAQTKQIRFKRLTIDDGLSLSSVYCIHQDSKGFMWFGTEDGLNRYDGKNFRIFRADPFNQNTISHKWIDQVYEDKSGNLWFGSRGGLTKFNPKYEIFKQFKESSDKSEKISSDTITALLEDNDNKIWVGTINGLNKIDIKTNKTHIFNKISARVNDLIIDKKGNVWIATSNGLYFYDNKNNILNNVNIAKINDENLSVSSLVIENDKLWIGSNIGLISYDMFSNEFLHFNISKSKINPNPEQAIEKLFLDKNNNLWVGALDGLYLFDKKNVNFKLYVYTTNVSNSQAISPIKNIHQDKKGNIWYATFGDGLFKIEKDGKLINYNNNPADPTSLSYNSIHSIFEDRAGVLWFGTFGAGISIYFPQAHKFDLITSDPNDENSLSTNFIWSILEANDGSVWIGTNNNGLDRYFPKTGKYIHYKHKPSDNTSLSNQTVRKIFQDSKSNIWIATNGGGLNKFIVKSGKFKHYKNIPNDLSSISNDFVRGIFEDKNGKLWVGTQNGLNCFNPNTEKFERFTYSTENEKSISHNYIYTGILQDKNDNLWVGTIGGGLNKMDIKSKTFKRYLNNPNEKAGISDNMVFSIYEDENKYLWIGTNSGLNKFDPKTEKFQRFGVKEGLPNEVIYSVLPDKNGNIWLSTNFGLSRFNISSFEVQNFTVNDGLQSNEFNGGAYHLGKSGLMYFAGVYGLNIFDPDKILRSENPSEIVITKIEIFGQQVDVETIKNSKNKVSDNYIFEMDGKYCLSENISYTNEIILDYDHNFFSLEFSALNMSIPEKVEYAYIMENLDKVKNYSGNRNFVSYVKMKPGRYIFKVRAKNEEGIWSNSIAELNIIIKPPFWKTWWFLLIEITIVFIFIFFIYRYLLKIKTNKILLSQNEKIKNTNLKLSESEKNLKELNATKDKFFSIISHDLKNPFSSVLSLSESVSMNFNDIDDEDKLSVFQKIHSSVKQIYSLLDNLLTWSRSQSKKLTFEPVEFNLSKLIEINVNLNRMPAENKGIKINSIYDNDLLVYADREMINTVIRNLVNNAVKFSSNGDVIEIKAIKENSNIKVSIKDQGIGISKKNIEKLFRIDMKFKLSGTSGEKGTGLGLILCKEFVEKNKGYIQVNSKLGEGSIFEFTIPKNNYKH